MNQKFKVNMLGQFSIAQEGGPIVEPSLKGKPRKLWLLVAYLIVNRERGVTANELIELFFPGSESDNPLATLQNNISRARASLEKYGISDTKALITFKEGLYTWSAPTVTDFETFDRAVTYHECMPEGELSADEGLRIIDLYTGDFLPEAASEKWVMSYNAHYRSEYLNLCAVTAERLVSTTRYDKAVELYTVGYEKNPLDLRFSTALMHTLTLNGKPKEALEIYDRLRKLYGESYGTVPPPALETERNSAEQELYNRKMNTEDFASLLSGLESGKGAFACDSRTFCRIVNLQLREYARSRINGQIVLLHIGRLWMNAERQAILLKQMENVLNSSLRSGDPFAIIGVKLMAILLPGASEENVQTVVDRIFRRFAEEYPGQPLDFAINSISLAELSEMRKQ